MLVYDSLIYENVVMDVFLQGTEYRTGRKYPVKLFGAVHNQFLFARECKSRSLVVIHLDA